MICIKCDKDLAECVCDDLEERYNKLLTSPHLFIGPEYRQRIKRHIEKLKAATTKKPEEPK